MKKLMGIFASVALLTSGAALAGDDKNKDKPAQTESSLPATQDPAYGGSGTMQGQSGMQGQMGTQNELTGTVLKANKRQVMVKSESGAIVTFKVDKKQLKLTDPNMQSITDMKEGTQIRANFMTEGMDNILINVQPAQPDTGGSGLMQPDTGINQPDTGGAGMDKGSDVDMDTGGAGHDMKH